MTINSQGLIELATQPRTAVARGRAMHLRGQPDATLAQQAFLDAYIDQPAVPATSYRHPEQVAVVAPHGDSNRLDPADIAWLQRIPPDPTEVTFDDAAQLAGMAQRVAVGTADHRLVESVWQPVKAVHDRRAAQAHLATAQRPHPDVPVSALSALANALANEVTELTAMETQDRAHARLVTAQHTEAAKRDQILAAARERVERLQSEAEDRQKVMA